jgi:hypothetical protein
MTVALRSPAALVALMLLSSSAADAFCGFYVGGAGAKLYNKASQVVIARVGDKTTITMRNDYRGDAEDFALIVPVPVVIDEDAVQTVPAALFDRLDTYSAPRLVEYHEQDPCYEEPDYDTDAVVTRGSGRSRRSRRVKVEAEFSVDEYDVQILSAEESTGLEAWLQEQGYAIPNGAARILAPYIKRQMKFFAAKVDPAKVKRQVGGGAVLTPLQVAFRTPTFELPIRLGMLNAEGVQDLIVYALTPSGLRTTVTNYPNPYIATDVELGERVPEQGRFEDEKDAFGRYYIRLFNTAQDNAGGAAVLTEYMWDSSACDPCPTKPLTPGEMAALGVEGRSGVVTRLHARYTNKLFKDDFKLAVSQKERNFQARFILRRPWSGDITCENPQRGRYRDQLRPMVGQMSQIATGPVAVSPTLTGVQEVRLRAPRSVQWRVGGERIAVGNRTVDLAAGLSDVIAYDRRLGGTIKVPIKSGVADFRRVREGRVQLLADPTVTQIRIGTMEVKRSEIISLRAGTYEVSYVVNRRQRKKQISVRADRSERMRLR